MRLVVRDLQVQLGQLQCGKLHPKELELQTDMPHRETDCVGMRVGMQCAHLCRWFGRCDSSQLKFQGDAKVLRMLFHLQRLVVRKAPQSFCARSQFVLCQVLQEE